MTPLRNGLSRVILFIILPAVVILTVLNIYLSEKLRDFAPAYLDKYSKLSGLNLHLDDIGLDPFFRVKLSGVKADDPSRPQAGLADIGTVIIDPGIISSIFGRQITIREIVLNRPAIRYDGGSFKKVLDMIEGGEGGGGASGVGIERIRLNDARMEISPDAVITSHDLVIVITKRGNKDESDIAIDGDIALFGNGMEVAGKVNIRPDDVSGKIRLVADKSQPGSATGSLVSDRNIRGIANISFKAAGTINSNGDISAVSLDNKNGSLGGELGRLDYAIEYDRDNDTARVDKLGFNLLNAVSGVLSGDVRDVTGGLVFDLRGSAASGDLKSLSARVPGIDPETLAGNIRSDDLRVEGSAGKNDLRLAGEAVLGGIGFAFADGSVKVSGLGCSVKVNQLLDGDSGFGFSSNGPCKADEFFEKDIGAVKSVSAMAGIKSGGLWKKNEFLLSDINGMYMDGTVSGSLKLTSENGETGLTGTISGRGLDLGKAPKSILPFDRGGTAGNLTADIQGKPGEYKAGVAFAVNDFVLRSELGREFRVASAKTTAPLDIEYKEEAAGGEADASAGAVRGKIVVRDKGLSYQSLSFGEYAIESGIVDDLNFVLDPAGDWSLGMSSGGTGFQVLGMDTGLSRFKEHIDIGESGRKGFSGTVEGTDGRFKSITFPSLSAEYAFDGDSLAIRKLTAEMSTAGELKTDNLSIAFGREKGGYPYKITLKDGTFSGYEGNLTADGIAGSFTVNNPDSGQAFWSGTASAAKADIFSGIIEGLHLDVAPSPDGVTLKEITGKFINGILKGKIEIVTSGPATRLITELGLESASSSSGGLDIALGRADFNFSASLTDNSLPQGTGKFSFSGLSVKREGLDTLYSGGFGTKTSGETLFLEDGFITNKDKSELRFSGQM
ncbi:MAG TPA: hypothetical protein VHC46_09700, partial [Thermodesulfobacteriota bacterium]|nr:hypothetical protein [Thermodesulfobacteriota bacterium]